MKRQKEAMRIMEALSGVDAELLARCEAAEAGGKTADTEGVVCGKSGKNAARWRYLSRCAAVLALLVAGAVSWKGLEMLRSTQNDGDASGGVPEAAAIEYKSNMDLDNEWIGNGDNGSQFPESMISEGMITGEGVQRGDGQKQPASAATDTSVNAAGGTDLLDSVSALGGKDAPGVTGSLDGTEGSGVTGSLDGTEGSGVTGSLDKQEVSGGTDGASQGEDLKMEGCSTWPAKVLTAEEALQVEPLGAYVPTALPADYVFETARYDEEKGRLTVCWSRGMDSITLSFEQVDNAAVETVNIGQPETYDERLYDLPFGETVPEGYRQAFFAPVFAKDDFSLEIVCARVISYNGDSGDTSTPRGNFSVLYDGVSVQFDGRGTPDEIWEMFASISEPVSLQ